MSQVMEKLDGFGVLALLLSGAFKLRYLLCNRGSLKKLRLVDLSDSSTSRWPLMVGELRGLEELTVVRPNSRLGCTSLVPNQLKNLPQLKLLHLECLDSGMLLVETRLRSLLPNLESLSISQLEQPVSAQDLPSTLTSFHAGTVFALPQLNCAEAALELPLLRSLTLEGPCTGRTNLTAFSLVQLEVSFSILPKTGDIFPATLTHLTLRGQLNSLDFLPLTLTYLNVHCTTDALRTRNLRRMPHLKSLILEKTKFTLLHLQALFPPSLQHLSIHYCYSLDRLYLPQDLKSLTIYLTTNQAIQFCYEPSATPASQRLLPLDHAIDIYDAATSSITTFIEGFPPGLEKLHLYSDCGWWRTDTSFPNHLKTGVPHTLTELTLQMTTPTHTTNDWDQFPDTMVSLTLNNFLPTHRHTLSRFYHLERLELDMSNLTVDFSLFSSLAPTLQHLSLKWQSGFEETFLSFLPKGLLSLKLIAIKEEDSFLTEKGIRFLGQLSSLYCLKLQLNLENLLDWMIRLIPRSLIRLELPGRKSKLSSVCFASLPRFLECFKVGYLVSVKGYHLASLPRGLRICSVLQLGNDPSFEEWDRVTLLPTTLRVVAFGNSPRSRTLDRKLRRSAEEMRQFPDERTASNSFWLHHTESFSSAVDPLVQIPSSKFHRRVSLASVAIGVVAMCVFLWYE
jgi:hypothetical protein